MKNSRWARDEIILTLDFYHQNYPSIPEQNSQEIIDLSSKLRKLQIRLGEDINEMYRNPNGVYMKLMNFHHLNPNHSGKGLSGASKLDEIIFDEFQNNIGKLNKISNSITKVINSDEPVMLYDVDDDDEFISQEGKLLTRIHRYRERDKKIVKRKKDQTLKQTGSMKCEGCGFDFNETYGERGRGFIECHHTKPISEMIDEEKTTLKDLSLVCSNCHRMIHRHRPWLTIEELRALIK